MKIKFRLMQHFSPVWSRLERTFSTMCLLSRLASPSFSSNLCKPPPSWLSPKKLRAPEKIFRRRKCVFSSYCKHIWNVQNESCVAGISIVHCGVQVGWDDFKNPEESFYITKYMIYFMVSICLPVTTKKYMNSLNSCSFRLTSFKKGSNKNKKII